MGSYQVRMLADKSKSADVYLYTNIGADMWGEGVTADQFRKDISALGAVKTIRLHINSEGGEVFDAIAMYNTLSKHPARVEAHIDGMALSAATIVLMAADKINMASNAMLMVHEPRTIARGDAAALRDAAAMLENVRASVIDTYASRRKLSAERVSQLMLAETWMRAETAMKEGFVDAISEAVNVSASFDPARFLNAPSWAQERMRATSAPSSADLTRKRVQDIARRAAA